MAVFTTAGKSGLMPPAVPCCRCGRRHKNWRTIAECCWPRAEWITGFGQWASVSLCPRGVTVQLYATRDEAEAAKRLVDKTRCGSQCWGPPQHRVIDLAAALAPGAVCA